MNSVRLHLSLLGTLLTAELAASVDRGASCDPVLFGGCVLAAAISAASKGTSTTRRTLIFVLHIAVYLIGVEATTSSFPSAAEEYSLIRRAVEHGGRGELVLRDRFEFRVASRPVRPSPGRVRFRVELAGTGAEILLDAADLPWSEISTVKNGDRGAGTIKLAFVGTQARIPPPVFSYDAFLYRRGIVATGKLEILESLVRSSSEADTRAEFIRRIVSEFGSTPQLAVVMASTLAEEDLLDETTKKLFRNTGLTHVLVVSGYQVGVLFVIVFFAARSLFRRSQTVLTLFSVDTLAAAAAFAASCAYAGLTGGPLTAVRAVFALAVLAVGRALCRRTHLWRSFFTVVIVTLIIWPGAWFEAGCQLMFAALLGLIAATRYAAYFSARWGMPRKAAALFAAAIFPSIMTTPIVIAWFEMYVPHSAVFNLLFAPAMSIICTTYGGLALLALRLGVPGSELLFSSALRLTELLLEILQALDAAFSALGLAPVLLEADTYRLALGGSIVSVVLAWLGYLRLPAESRTRLDLQKLSRCAKHAGAIQNSLLFLSGLLLYRGVFGCSFN